LRALLVESHSRLFPSFNATTGSIFGRHWIPAIHAEHDVLKIQRLATDPASPISSRHEVNGALQAVERGLPFNMPETARLSRPAGRLLQ